MNEKQLQKAKRLAWVLVTLNIFDLFLSIRRVLKLRDEQPALPDSED